MADTLSQTLLDEGEQTVQPVPPFTDVMPPMRSVGSFGDPEQSPVVATPSQPDGAYSISYPYLLPPYRPMASVPDYPLMGVYAQNQVAGTTLNFPAVFQDGAMIWRGAWDAGVQYNQYDVVEQNVSTYLALTSSLGQSPDEFIGTVWALIGENFNFRGQWSANPITISQSAHASGASDTFTLAYANPVTAGNWLYAAYQTFWASGTTSNVPTVADSLGNSWVKLGTTIIAQGNSGTNCLQQAIFGCQATFGGTNTVTFTGTEASPSSSQANVFEYNQNLMGGFDVPSFATASIFTGGIGLDVIIPDEGPVLITAGYSALHNNEIVGFTPTYFTKQNANIDSASGLQLITGGGYESAVEALYSVTCNVPEGDIGAVAHIVPLLPPAAYLTATKYNPFDVVIYQGSTYVAIYPTNSNPIAGLGTYWVLLSQGTGFSQVQTGDYTPVATDNGSLLTFDITAAHTLTLPSPPPNAGWWIGVQNSIASTAVLTVSPNSLTLDGSTASRLLTPNEGFLIFSDGTNYFTQSSSVLLGGVNIQSTGATYTAVPADNGKLIAVTSTAAIVKLPAAPPSSSWTVSIAGVDVTATVNPNGLDLDGSGSSIIIPIGEGITIYTDGSNYYSVRGSAAVAGGVNAQTGATYTILASDNSKLITFDRSGGIAVTLPAAGTAGFGTQWYTDVQNIGPVGNYWVVITPTTSTIDGATTLTIQSGSGCRIFSDGTNYRTNRGSASLTLDNLDDTALPRTAQYFRPAQFTTDVCVDNASFQASTSLVNGAPPGWYNATPADGTVSYNTSTPYIGGQCMQITGQNGADVANCRVITVMPGETYEVSGWIKTDGVCLGQIELIYTNYPITTAGTIIASSSSSSWTYVSQTGTIPTTTGSGGYVLGILACTLGSGAAGSVANFQNIRIHRIMGASGTYSSPGLVPDPGQSAGTTRFLREDATWDVPSSAPAFSSITSGTNTGAAMLVGTGASLGPTGSGTINATAIDGVTVTGTPTAGQAPVATSGTAASWQAISANAVNAVPIPNIARWWYGQYIGASGATTTAASIQGLSLVVTNGNASGISAAFGQYFGTYSGAAANTTAGFLTPAQFYIGHSLTMTSFQSWYNANTADAGNFWTGFTDRTLAVQVASANPAGNYACFRYIEGTDTTIKCVTKDGTTQTVTDSGVTPAAGFWALTAGHLFQIVSNDGVPNVQFYIDGALVATNTTHLPTSGTATSWICGQTTLASAQGVGCAVSYVYLTATI